MRRALVIGLGALLALPACGSSGGFDTMPAGDAAATPATSPSTAPRAVTTTTGAAAPVTTVPATTTTMSLDASAVAGLAEIQANLIACVVAPSSCDPSTVAMRGTPAFDRLDTLIQGYVADGISARDIGKARHTVESVRIGLDEASAVIVWCSVDGNLLVDPGASPGEADDVIIDDWLNSRRIEGSFLLTSEGWRRSDSKVLDEWLGEDRCPAS